jgi:hypothetical protein
MIGDWFAQINLEYRLTWDSLIKAISLSKSLAVSSSSVGVGASFTTTLSPRPMIAIGCSSVAWASMSAMMIGLIDVAEMILPLLLLLYSRDKNLCSKILIYIVGIYTHLTCPPEALS